MSTPREKRALVACYSNLEFDPRVTREIDWLTSDGWLVDTLGFGAKPTAATSRHFALRPQPRIVRSSIAKGVVHLTLPHPMRFRLLVESQIPAALEREKPEDGYDFILVNDIDLLPWIVRHGRKLTSNTPDSRIHLDVHEFHLWAAEPGMSALQKWALSRYHAWIRSHIGSPIFRSRSTVADGIAELYATEFGFDRPSTVRNSPAYVDQQPSSVDSSHIELIYHGNAEMARGLDLLIDAFRLLEPRFRLNLMLTGSSAGKRALAELTRDLAERVTFIEPVPMAEVANAINAFDIEVIFYPPTSPNFLYSFPNKFFESVQGRLAVVIGQSPSMEAIVSQYGNGVIVDGWSSQELATALNALDVADIERMKRASGASARDLNSAVERDRFFAGIHEEARA
ncbi:MAG: glycosyltransferase [Microbacteriaceae bacterium]|nr:MAG: glycosyltransferase [Microbacteriaceae bacterium]